MMSLCKFPHPTAAVAPPQRRRLPVRNPVVNLTVRRKKPEIILPALPTPTDLMPLSVLDMALRLRTIVHAIFFYRRNPKMDGADPAAVIRKALAKTLAYYYPFAGRLLETPDSKLAVDCSGPPSGALFVEADADIELDEIGDDVYPPSPNLHLFLCSEDGNVANEYEKSTISGPLLLIQVTRFKCNGFALGVGYNHTIADGYGALLMLTAMAELARGENAPSTIPVWERQHLFTARSPPQVSHVEKYYYQYPDSEREKMKEAELNLTTPASILLTSENIQAMRDRHDLHSCTKFELITACLWKTRTALLKPDPDEITRVTCAANARATNRRLVPKGYYGNAVFTPSAACTAKEMASKRMGEVVEMVRETKGALRDPEYLRSTVDNLATRPSLPHVRLNLTVSDISGFGFDLLDFGWGEPFFAGSPVVRDWVAFYQMVRLQGSGGGKATMLCLRIPKGFEADFSRMMMGQ